MLRKLIGAVMVIAAVLFLLAGFQSGNLSGQVVALSGLIGIIGLLIGLRGKKI